MLAPICPVADDFLNQYCILQLTLAVEFRKFFTIFYIYNISSQNLVSVVEVTTIRTYSFKANELRNTDKI